MPLEKSEVQVKNFYKVKIIEKMKVIYPIPADLSDGNDSYGSRQFIMKAIAASLCGATIPAIIFYFLM